MKPKTKKRPKTGGRQKGSAGVRVFLTIPKETAAQMPSNTKELKGAALDAILQKFSPHNNDFMPDPGDTRYMNEDDDRFPETHDRQQ